VVFPEAGPSGSASGPDWIEKYFLYRIITIGSYGFHISICREFSREVYNIIMLGAMQCTDAWAGNSAHVRDPVIPTPRRFLSFSIRNGLKIVTDSPPHGVAT
jgi:hypothetical protein